MRVIGAPSLASEGGAGFMRPRRACVLRGPAPWGSLARMRIGVAGSACGGLVMGADIDANRVAPLRCGDVSFCSTVEAVAEAQSVYRGIGRR